MTGASPEVAAAGDAPRMASRVAALWALVALVVLVASFALRAPFPYVLEWQESAMLEHAMRVRSGAGVYVEPTPEFAPFPYPPLFHWVGAASLALFGAGLPTLRLVSIASTVALLVCAYGIARRSGGRTAGLATIGFLAASYTLTGQWLDVARVDALALALCAASLMCATSPAALEGRAAPGLFGSLQGALLGGTLCALATLAKQTSLGLAVAVAVGLALRPASRRSAAAFVAAFALVLVPTAMWLESASDGWFSFTTLDVLAGSPWHGPAILGFWVEMSLLLVPIAALVLAGRGTTDDDDGRPRTHPVTPIALASLVAIGWIGRAHEGAYLNTLLPAALAASLVAGPATARACQRRPAVAVILLLIAFPALLFVPPRGATPNALDLERAERVAERIAAIEGEVWTPHGAVDPNVPGGVHAMAITDLLKSRETEVAQRFVDDLSRALDERRFAAIVFAVDPSEWADLPALSGNYRPAERLDLPTGAVDPARSRAVFVTPTGAPYTPRYLLLPR